MTIERYRFSRSHLDLLADLLAVWVFPQGSGSAIGSLRALHRAAGSSLHGAATASPGRQRRPVEWRLGTGRQERRFGECTESIPLTNRTLNNHQRPSKISLDITRNQARWIWYRITDAEVHFGSKLVNQERHTKNYVVDIWFHQDLLPGKQSFITNLAILQSLQPGLTRLLDQECLRWRRFVYWLHAIHRHSPQASASIGKHPQTSYYSTYSTSMRFCNLFVITKHHRKQSDQCASVGCSWWPWDANDHPISSLRWQRSTLLRLVWSATILHAHVGPGVIKITSSHWNLNSSIILVVLGYFWFMVFHGSLFRWWSLTLWQWVVEDKLPFAPNAAWTSYVKSEYLEVSLVASYDAMAMAAMPCPSGTLWDTDQKYDLFHKTAWTALVLRVLGSPMQIFVDTSLDERSQRSP